jgi:hypothetical protein
VVSGFDLPWLVIGAEVGAALLILLNFGKLLRLRDAPRALLASHYLLKGICLSVSLSFIATKTAGAIRRAHSADSTSRCLGPGHHHGPRHPHPLPQPRPISDSLEAARLLILLACIAVMRLRR